MQAVISGARLSWTTAGDPNGPPLVLVHGFPFNSGMWRPQLEEPPPGWRIIAPDLRGFGASSAAGESSLTMDRFAADIVTLLQHLGMTNAVFCGLSMGGYVLFALLRQQPKLVRALVLADTRAAADSEDAKRARIQTATKVKAAGTAAFIDDMMPKLLSRVTRLSRPGVEVELRTIMESAPADSVAAALHGLADRPDSTATAQSINVPTLIIVGAEDEITPPGEARLLTRGIRGSQIVEIRDAGHVSNLEQPADFNRGLTSFLTSLS